jgi:hypothetical protein
MSNTSDHPEKGRVFVDEDWKARAQAEKEALQRAQEAKQAESAASAESARAPGPTGPLPAPSLELLASTLAMQAMVSLGLVPHPASGKAEFRADEAKHLIDMLQMLRDKTEGNRTAEETATFDHLLHELRLGYVAVQEKAKTQGAG